MKQLILALALVAPVAAFAAGEQDTTPPEEDTETVTECTDGQIWDDSEDVKACVDPEKEEMKDEARLKAVRELAYVGRYNDSIRVLDSVTDQSHDMVMTYRGFTARKMGNHDAAMQFYGEALAANPNNLLVRSYMGQAFVETGELELARAQLSEIRSRGGRGTWPELSLRLAIESGKTFSY